MITWAAVRTIAWQMVPACLLHWAAINHHHESSTLPFTSHNWCYNPTCCPSYANSHVLTAAVWLAVLQQVLAPHPISRPVASSAPSALTQTQWARSSTSRVCLLRVARVSPRLPWWGPRYSLAGLAARQERARAAIQPGGLARHRFQTAFWLTYRLSKC